MASHPALGYSYPADLQTFPRQKSSSPQSSPTLTSINSPSNAYPSPPTSPMSNYIYNKTSSGRISPPSFSLGHPAATAQGSNDFLELRRKSTGPQQYTMTTSTASSANKKGGFFW
ncbi:hypothetical protein BGX28_004189 [Mortierella sp. GBA30]|nr:hypothetical protein BGX28_004189 [Mortierella sp. GBA30]